MMTDIKCPPTPELRSFVLGQLPEETSDALVQHLRHCSDCVARIETIDDGEDSLVADLRGLSPYDQGDASPYEQVALAKALGALSLAGDPAFPMGQSSAELAPRVHTTIGEYESVRPLLQGGLGSVFLARHTKLGRQVALKVLATHRLADGRMRERFEAEMRAVGRLSHPNIVTAHDARDVDGTAVLVTEFIDGLDLGQLLQRTGPLSIANACEIVRQVAVALQYVHEQGFVHRDVKPSNIMLSRAGEVKLLDLGLARLRYGDPDHAEITGTGQAMGTADYIAPEQVTDSRQVDIRSDLYALGCTLMKLLSGTAPFADEAHQTPYAKMNAHVSTPAPSLKELMPDASVELTKLIGRLLQKDPVQRPQQPQDLMQVLLPLTNGSDLAKLATQSITLPDRPNPEPRAASTAARPKVWYRRPVPIIAAIAAGFLGAFLGLCCGILIKIKYPDGTELTIEAPAGSEVSVSSEDTATEPAPTAGATADFPTKVEFAVVVRPEDISEEDRAAAIRLLEKTIAEQPGSQSVPTTVGTWYRTAERINVPINYTIGGQNFVLVSNAAIDIIRFRQFNGHMLGATIRPNGHFVLAFDETLAQEMRQLSRNNIGKFLAILLDDQLIATPKIMSEISTQIEVIGNFTPEQTQALRHTLLRHALLSAQSQVAPSESANLKMIGLAFHNFHSAHRKLPGSANLREGGLSSAGKPIQDPFSWRVAILPFLGEAELFTQYHFDEPWDSEHNLRVLDKMPEVYRSPQAAEDQPKWQTNYLGVAGEGGMLAGSGLDFADCTDGTSGTVLVAESKHSVPWTKPEDLNSLEIETFADVPLRLLMVDGKVMELKQPVDSDLLRRLFIRNDDKPITQEELR